MSCPKCEEGNLNKIVFSKGNRQAVLCDFCGMVWYEKERINALTGQLLSTLTKGGDEDYTFIDDEKNDDQKTVHYPKYK